MAVEKDQKKTGCGKNSSVSVAPPQKSATSLNSDSDILKISRILKATHRSSQAMMRAEDETKYAEEVCRILIEDCGYKMMWVGFAENDEGKTVRPVAYSGFEQGYLETLRITWADTERGRGPTGISIRTGKPSICRNMLTDPAFAPWRQEALKRGYASSLVLPLMTGGKTFGVISIYSGEPDAFSDDEVDLLSELASDLAYGIAAIRTRAANVQAEEDVKSLAKFPEENPFPVLRLSADGTILFSNGPGGVLLDEWRCKVGQKAPKNWRVLILAALASSYYQVEEVSCGDKIFSIIAAPIVEEGYVNLYGRDITKQKQMELALQASEQSVRKKLESILFPEGDTGCLELADIVDAPSLQALMDHFYQLTRIPMAIIDLAGKQLVGVGWQDICTKFHRVNPQTCKFCIESDVELSAVAAEGKFKLYKCKNNLWDAATPLIIGGKKMGNLFAGQFFFDDEIPDYNFFRAQARRYGFNETEYMTALDKVPRLSRNAVNQGMEFLYGLSRMISQTSYSNIKLARQMEERKRVEEAFRKSEERLRQALDAAEAAPWETDLVTGKVFASPRMAKIYGIDQTSLPQTRTEWRAFVLNEDRALLDSVLDAAAQGDGKYHVDFRIRRPDGDVRWIRGEGQLHKDEQGQPSRMAGLLTDITERKQAEEKLRFQAQILDQIHDGVIWTDLGGSILGLNKGAERAFGYTSQELFGKPISIIHPPDQNQLLQQEIIEPLKTKGSHQLEVRHRKKTGEDFWTELSLSLLKNDNGIPIGMIGYALDITERKQMEDALRQSREDLNRAQAVGRVGSWRLDVRKNELTWSDESHCIFGVSKGMPMTYETFLSSIHPEDVDFVDTRWKAALAGEDYDIEHRILVGGQVKWVREKAYLEFDNKGQLVGGFGITQDITQRKQMENQLRQSHDALEARVKQRTAELVQTVDSLEDEVRQRLAAEQAVKAERKRFEDVLEMMPSYAILLTPDYRVAYANGTFRKWFGDDHGKKCYEFLFGRTEPCENCQTFEVLKTGQSQFWEWTGPNGHNYDIYDYPFTDTDGSPLIMEIGLDVTAHKQTQARIQFTNVLLELFTKNASRKEYLDSVVAMIHEWSGCECVGIRLKDDDGWIPYVSCVGFSDEFMATENSLSLTSDNCLCIRAIMNSQELADTPLVTPRGSFCSEDTFTFLDTLTAEEKSRYRGTCMRHGFASLAVIPIRYREQIVGAIHLADQRKNKTPPEMIEFLEHTEMLIGEAIHRFNVEESLQLSRSRLLEAQRRAHLGNWQWDMITGKILCSDEVYRIFGFQPQQMEVTYDTFLSCVHPEDRKFMKGSLAAALKEKKILRLDHRIVRPDASERVVHENAEIAYDENQNPIKMVGTVHDITERKQAEEAIRQNQQALRDLTAQLQLTEERERRQIAQDLHDSVGQILAFSSMELGHVQKSLPEQAAHSLKLVSEQLREAIKQVRTLSFDLSPGTLYDLGFEVAVEDLVERFSKERNIPCRFENCRRPKPLREDVKILLYRSLRELLINAAKHSRAETIRVSLLRSSSDLYAIVEDDGQGFDASALENNSRKAGGFGLFSIRERLNHIGGQLKIESVAGKGTKAVLIAPLDIEKEEKEYQ